MDKMTNWYDIDPCWCDYVDIGVGWQMVRPDHDCPTEQHRWWAYNYYDSRLSFADTHWHVTGRLLPELEGWENEGGATLYKEPTSW